MVAVGCWLVCAEWQRDDTCTWHRIGVQSVRVDGDMIKPDTWYTIKDGTFVPEEQ
jgi:hypothetical protein